MQLGMWFLSKEKDPGPVICLPALLQASTPHPGYVAGVGAVHPSPAAGDNPGACKSKQISVEQGAIQKQRGKVIYLRITLISPEKTPPPLDGFISMVLMELQGMESLQ